MLRAELCFFLPMPCGLRRCWQKPKRLFACTAIIQFQEVLKFVIKNKASKGCLRQQQFIIKVKHKEREEKTRSKAKERLGPTCNHVRRQPRERGEKMPTRTLKLRAKITSRSLGCWKWILNWIRFSFGEKIWISKIARYIKECNNILHHEYGSKQKAPTPRHNSVDLFGAGHHASSESRFDFSFN